LGIAYGVDMIMIGHLVAPWIDEKHPASLSSLHEQYVRNLGFTGLLVTDDLQMIRGDYHWKDSLRLTLESNIDLLLYVDPSMQEKVLDQAIAWYQDGKFSRENLQKSLLRILTKKQGLGKNKTIIPRRLVE
jgi:beta-N-acetylhexosaminidase